MTDERRLVSREGLAAALDESGLTKRLTDYAIRAHPDTMSRDEPNVSQSWADAIFAALPQPATEPALDGHEDDGEGGCVVCRVWERGSEDVYFRIPFPCPTARLAAQPSAEVERLRAALLHATMRRHDFSAGCDGCLNVQHETRAALASDR